MLCCLLHYKNVKNFFFKLWYHVYQHKAQKKKQWNLVIYIVGYVHVSAMASVYNGSLETVSDLLFDGP